MIIFHSYVSLPEGTANKTLNQHNDILMVLFNGKIEYKVGPDQLPSCDRWFTKPVNYYILHKPYLTKLRGCHYIYIIYVYHYSYYQISL